MVVSITELPYSSGQVPTQVLEMAMQEACRNVLSRMF